LKQKHVFIKSKAEIELLLALYRGIKNEGHKLFSSGAEVLAIFPRRAHTYFLLSAGRNSLVPESGDLHWLGTSLCELDCNDFVTCGGR
jgi:hypothetical protein